MILAIALLGLVVVLVAIAVVEKRREDSFKRRGGKCLTCFDTGVAAGGSRQCPECGLSAPF